MTTTGELVEACLGGDGAALGLLLERHRAWSYAVALGYLRDPWEAQDVVQDAFLSAIEHVGDLRDPEAFTSWLGRVVRNAAVARLRRSHPEPVAIDWSGGDLGVIGDRTERTLEAGLLGDWVWGAVGRLPEHLRVVVMLRHFGRQHPYVQIAAVLGIPVGTVRSRLFEARSRLGRMLLDGVEDDWQVRRRATLERQRMEQAVAELAYHRPEGFTAQLSDDVRVVLPDGSMLHGRDRLVAAVDDDLAAGVGLRLAAVSSSPGITILDALFVNPADDPGHCPAGMTQVRLGRDDITTEIRVLYTSDGPGDHTGVAQTL